MSFLDAGRGINMKFLTLSLLTVGWKEMQEEEKFKHLKKCKIPKKAKYDIIYFRKLTKNRETSVVDTDAYYITCTSISNTIHQDHFVRPSCERKRLALKERTSA